MPIFALVTVGRFLSSDQIWSILELKMLPCDQLSLFLNSICLTLNCTYRLSRTSLSPTFFTDGRYGQHDGSGHSTFSYTLLFIRGKWLLHSVSSGGCKTLSTSAYVYSSMSYMLLPMGQSMGAKCWFVMLK